MEFTTVTKNTRQVVRILELFDILGKLWVSTCAHCPNLPLESRQRELIAWFVLRKRSFRQLPSRSSRLSLPNRLRSPRSPRLLSQHPASLPHSLRDPPLWQPGGFRFRARSALL